MNVALYGIHGTYNFGCEAIVRGAYSFIKDIFPGAHIVYFSYSYEYDHNILKDLNIDVVPIKIKHSLIRQCSNKALSILGIKKRLFSFNQKELLNNIDLILSIGGDIYTIPSVRRAKRKYEYYNHLVDFCSRIDIPVVVYGASVGPWGEYKKAVEYYQKHLKKYKLILCRELSSVDYLEGMGFNNICFFPDPAFQLGEGGGNNGDYIGINLSPLSLDEVYGEHGTEQIKKMAKLLDCIYEQLNSPILLLPHVLSPNENDNDLLFLEKIKKHMDHHENALIASSDGGFLGIKKSIRKCRIVVSARMHCAINAIEENVPTIFLSYSQKSSGMCEYVYGNRRWVVNLKQIEEDLINRMKELELQSDEVIKQLVLKNREISEDYRSNIAKVKKMLG